MKKVGIITYHNINNYGTMLQAFALQNVIENMGYDVQIINYLLRDKELSSMQKLKLRFKIAVQNPIKFLHKLFGKLNNNEKIQNEKFKKFQDEEFKLSEEFNSLEDLKRISNYYDIYIVGSDQTWNPYLPIHSDAYLLSFANNNKIKASYAPSTGVSYISESLQRHMKQKLDEFDYLSCRDITGKNILDKLLNKNIELVVDPTLLMEKNDWLKIAKKIQLPPKYILCYSLGENDTCRNSADNFGKNKNIPVYHIYTNYKCELKHRKVIYDAGPAEFITLINSAEYVFTDSFHATIFSINFQKQFFSFCKNKDGEGSDNQRLKDVLEEYNLEKRLIGEYNLQDINIVYDSVMNILKVKRKESLEYLKKILESEK